MPRLALARAQVSWHRTGPLTGRYGPYDRTLLTPLVETKAKNKYKHMMWRAEHIVPIVCWAVPSTVRGKSAIMARHWDALASVGLPLPPLCPPLPSCLLEHSVPRLEGSDDSREGSELEDDE